MNLIPCIGFRKVYRRAEVLKFTGMTVDQLKKSDLKPTRKRPYSYTQSDVNAFLTRLNAPAPKASVRA
jgi:hypothetical protein